MRALDDNKTEEVDLENEETPIKTLYTPQPSNPICCVCVRIALVFICGACYCRGRKPF